MTLFDQLLLIAFCMLVAAFLSGIETGVVSIHRLQLEHIVRRGDKDARILQDFLDNSDRLFGATLVGTNLSFVIVSVVSAGLLADVLGNWAEVASTLADTVLLLIFCEYIPKTWFHAKPLERSRMFATTLRFCEVVLRPIALGAVWITKLFVRMPDKAFTRAAPFVTKEDLKLLVDEGEKTGLLSSSRRMMIHNVLELTNKTARDIRIPRERMTVVYADTLLPDFLKIARDSRFTRIPVLDRSTNVFTGIVNVFFVVSEAPQAADKTIAGFVRKPLFIPETMPVDKILPIMRRSRQPICLVINENNDVTGLVTAEDITREIVGKP
ncbi:MAG: hemolysin family protein [Verrucomicrobiota bacterium]|nr:hemolysin family protein [Verrucomicrobiota bacterium]